MKKLVLTLTVLAVGIGSATLGYTFATRQTEEKPVIKQEIEDKKPVIKEVINKIIIEHKPNKQATEQQKPVEEQKPTIMEQDETIEEEMPQDEVVINLRYSEEVDRMYYKGSSEDGRYQYYESEYGTEYYSDGNLYGLSYEQLATIAAHEYPFDESSHLGNYPYEIQRYYASIMDPEAQ